MNNKQELELLREFWNKHKAWGPQQKNTSKNKHRGFGSYFDWGMYDGGDSGDAGGVDESLYEVLEEDEDYDEIIDEMLHAIREAGVFNDRSDDMLFDQDGVFINEQKGPCWSGYEQYGMKDKEGKEVPNCVPVREAKYKGKKVKLNKPTRTPDGPKKFKVYVKNAKGNVIMVRFGDPNMKIKKSDPKRRKSFRARHNCDNPGPKTKARYWSCKNW